MDNLFWLTVAVLRLAVAFRCWHCRICARCPRDDRQWHSSRASCRCRHKTGRIPITTRKETKVFLFFFGAAIPKLGPACTQSFALVRPLAFNYQEVGAKHLCRLHGNMVACISSCGTCSSNNRRICVSLLPRSEFQVVWVVGVSRDTTRLA